MDARAEVTPDITDCVNDWQEVLEAELDGRLIENLHAAEAERVLAFADALAAR